jgi:hypothetical protein
MVMLIKLLNYRFGIYAGGMSVELQDQAIDPSLSEVGVITKLLPLTVASMVSTIAVITPACTPMLEILKRASVETPKLL